MSLFRPVPVLAVLLIATLGIGIACGSDAPTPPRSTAMAPSRPAYSRTAASDFHRNNKQDWVGVAHNRALDRFFGDLAKHHSPTDACTQLAVIINDPELIPVEHRAQRNAATAAIGAHALAGFGCPHAVGQAKPGTVSLANLDLVQSTTLSPEAAAIVTQLDNATVSAVNSTDLANQYNAILPAAANLSPGEADVVNASASVGLSSAEYWEANAAAVQANTQSSYGGCLQTDASPTVDGAMLTCVGITQPVRTILPVRFGGTAPADGLRLVALGCTYQWSIASVGQADFEGAVAGAAGAFFTSTPIAPVSVPVAALGVGASASVARSLWDFGSDLWCFYHGGTSTPTKKT